MAIPPAITEQKFYEKKAPVEAISVVPPIIIAAVTAGVNISDPAKRTFGWVLVGGIVWLAVSSVAKILNASAQDREQKQKLEHGGLRGALYVLHAAVMAHVGRKSENDRALRITVHRVVPPSKKRGAAEELEQLVPYVGAGGGGADAGRTFSIRSGIIGKAVREKAPFAASRRTDDFELFIRELVSEWAYTEHDARKLSPDRRAWMAVPIFGHKRDVVAVVYLDSNDPEFFRPDVQVFVIEACEALATYIYEAYR